MASLSTIPYAQVHSAAAIETERNGLSAKDTVIGAELISIAVSETVWLGWRFGVPQLCVLNSYGASGNVAIYLLRVSANGKAPVYKTPVRTRWRL